MWVVKLQSKQVVGSVSWEVFTAQKLLCQLAWLATSTKILAWISGGAPTVVAVLWVLGHSAGAWGEPASGWHWTALGDQGEEQFVQCLPSWLESGTGLIRPLLFWAAKMKYLSLARALEKHIWIFPRAKGEGALQPWYCAGVCAGRDLSCFER